MIFFYFKIVRNPFGRELDMLRNSLVSQICQYNRRLLLQIDYCQKSVTKWTIQLKSFDRFLWWCYVIIKQLLRYCPLIYLLPLHCWDNCQQNIRSNRKNKHRHIHWVHKNVFSSITLLIGQSGRSNGKWIERVLCRLYLNKPEDIYCTSHGTLHLNFDR